MPRSSVFAFASSFGELARLFMVLAISETRASWIGFPDAKELTHTSELKCPSFTCSSKGVTCEKNHFDLSDVAGVELSVP
jgi:hypothetical protein